MTDLEILIAYYISLREGDVYKDYDTFECGETGCDHCSFKRACDALDDGKDKLEIAEFKFSERIFPLLNTPEHSEKHLRQLYPELFI